MSSLSGTIHIPGGGSLYMLIISLKKKNKKNKKGHKIKNR